MRDSNHGQTVCGTSGSNLGENELGGLFRSVTSSMPGKFHFNLLVFGCPVGGGGWGNSARQLLCYKYHCCLCFLVLYGGSGS